MVKTPLSMPGAQIRSLVGGTRILHAMQHGQKIKTKIKSILGKMRTGFSATCLYCTGENCSRRRDYKCGGGRIKSNRMRERAIETIHRTSKNTFHET